MYLMSQKRRKKKKMLYSIWVKTHTLCLLDALKRRHIWALGKLTVSLLEIECCKYCDKATGWKMNLLLCRAWHEFLVVTLIHTVDIKVSVCL